MLLKSFSNFLMRDLLLDKLECASLAGALAAEQELFRSKALCGHFQKVPAGLGEWKVIKHINRHSSIDNGKSATYERKSRSGVLTEVADASGLKNQTVT